MATVIQPVDQPVLMDGVSWDTYESLLADGGDHRRTRMTFDQGVLEIVTPSYQHEHVENIVTRVAEALMNAPRQDYAPAGSITFKARVLNAASSRTLPTMWSTPPRCRD